MRVRERRERAREKIFKREKQWEREKLRALSETEQGFETDEEHQSAFFSLLPSSLLVLACGSFMVCPLSFPKDWVVQVRMVWDGGLCLCLVLASIQVCVCVRERRRGLCVCVYGGG